MHRQRVSAAVDLLLVAAAAGFALAPVVRNGFVNWDDPTVLLGNTRLTGAGVVEWAFSTTLIGHFQPLAWLMWSALARTFGLSPEPFHATSLLLHVINAALVYALAGTVMVRTAAPPRAIRGAALAASLLFLVHPVVVEPVAWASAYPYVAALTPLLGATLAYLTGKRTVAVACYAVSILVRPVAIGFPLVLLALDAWPLKRMRRTPLTRLVGDKAWFIALSVVGGVLEWRSRDVAGLQDVGLGARLTDAAKAPFVYALRLIWPVRLSPLDALPIAPAPDWGVLVAGVAALAVVSLVVWARRRTSAAPAAAWFAFLVLLLPVAGLLPSGVQATADRYLYVPAVLCAIAAAALIAQLATSSSRAFIAAAAAVGVVIAFAVLTRQQVGYWHDSIALWSRAIELDPRNDVALYNLAVALAEQGRDDEAMQRYEQTIALVPDHDLARRELAKLKERRTRTETTEGLAMVQQGRSPEAAARLRAAVNAGAHDATTTNALAYALMQSGRSGEAVAILDRASADHPGDVNLKHNLARMLATADDESVRDPERAIALAKDVCASTGNRDPRALDTLALAYAAAGERTAARDTARAAAALARQMGDPATAAAIDAHAAAFAR